MDISPEEMSNNVSSHIMLCGDAKAVIKQVCMTGLYSSYVCDYVHHHAQLNEEMLKSKATPVQLSFAWWSSVKEKMEKNLEISKVTINYSHTIHTYG